MLRGAETYRPFRCDVEPQGPPSSYAVAAVLDGESGAIPRLVGLTVLRAIFIIPALYLGSRVFARDLKFWQTCLLSLSASSGISSGMLVWYKIQRKLQQRQGSYPRAIPGLDGWRVGR